MFWFWSVLFPHHYYCMCHCVRFVAKPDSPCIYMEGNSGPDGCAIFYRGDKFSCESWHSRVLQVWRVESNQVSWDWRGAVT